MNGEAPSKATGALGKLSDLFYAPIGLVAGASKVIPELAEQGRIQVGNARMMGEMATRMGTRKLAEHLSGFSTRSLLVRTGLVPADSEPDAGTAMTTESEAPAAAEDPAPRVEATVHAPGAEELAIVDYDSLAASQVVPRLVALDEAELEDVRRYELANRGRKTILGRIAQLQA